MANFPSALWACKTKNNHTMLVTLNLTLMTCVSLCSLWYKSAQILNVMAHFASETLWGWVPHALNDPHLNLKPNLGDSYNRGKKKIECAIKGWHRITWITLNKRSQWDQTHAVTTVDVSSDVFQGLRNSFSCMWPDVNSGGLGEGALPI